MDSERVSDSTTHIRIPLERRVAAGPSHGLAADAVAQVAFAAVHGTEGLRLSVTGNGLGGPRDWRVDPIQALDAGWRAGWLGARPGQNRTGMRSQWTRRARWPVCRWCSWGVNGTFQHAAGSHDGIKTRSLGHGHGPDPGPGSSYQCLTLCVDGLIVLAKGANKECPRSNDCVFLAGYQGMFVDPLSMKLKLMIHSVWL